MANQGRPKVAEVWSELWKVETALAKSEHGTDQNERLSGAQQALSWVLGQDVAAPHELGGRDDG